MKKLLGLLLVVAACDSSDDKTNAQTATDAGVDASETTDTDDAGSVLAAATVLDLDDVKTNPTDYEWFDFRPNVQKLILAGAAETEHIAILWYTTKDGGVGLHYHSKTESVYVIDGTQTDGKGTYPTGSLYFNPPGSGHQITDSSGFFLLAYAAPPDFMSTDRIGEYEPIRIDTTAPDFTSDNPFDERQTGIRTFAPSLDATGGMSAEFISTASKKPFPYTGNYLLVLSGSCTIEGTTYAPNMLVVGKTVERRTYEVSAPKGSECLALGVSF
jgi:hypothetical protein